MRTSTILRFLLVAATSSIPVFLLVLSTWANVPTLWSPYSALATAGAIGSLRVIEFGVVSGFIAWNWNAIRGIAGVPSRFVVVGIAGALLSVIYFAMTASTALTHYGAAHFGTLLVLNVSLPTLVALTARRARDASTYGPALLLSVLLFSWLTWIAFPWLVGLA